MPRLRSGGSARIGLAALAIPHGVSPRALVIQASVVGSGTVTFGDPAAASVSVGSIHAQGRQVSVSGGMVSVGNALAVHSVGRPGQVQLFVVGVLVQGAGSGETLHWAIGDPGAASPAVVVSRRHTASVSLPSAAPSRTGAVLVALTARGAAGGLLNAGSSPHALAPVLGLGPKGSSTVTVLIPAGRDRRVRFATRSRPGLRVSVRVLAYAAPSSDGSPGAAWLLARYPIALGRVTGRSLTGQVAGQLGIPSADASSPPTGALVSVQAAPGGGTAALLPVPGPTNDARTVSVADAATPYVAFPAGQGGSATLVVPLRPDGTFRLRRTSRRISVRVLGATAGDLQLHAGTHLLHGSDLAGLAQVAGRTLRFHGVPVDLSHVQPGQVIVAGLTTKTPHGLLRKVTGVSRSGGNLILSTAAATLRDVLVKGTVSASESLTQANMTSSVPGSRDVRLTRQTRSDSGGFGVSFDTDIIPDHPVAGPSSIQITGSGLNISPTMNFTGGVSLLPPSVQAQFTVGASESFDIHAKVTGAFRDLSLSKEIWKTYFSPVDVQLGPIPIFFVPEAVIDLNVSGSAGADLSAGLSQHRDFTYGVGVDTTRSGGPFYLVDNTSPNSLTTDPTVFRGNAQLQFGASVGLNFLIDWATGPGIEVGPFVSGSADTAANPWWKVCFGLSAGVDFDVNLLGGDLSYSHDLAKLQTCPWNAGGPFATVTISPSSATVARGATRQFSATTAGVGPGINWSADGGTVSSTGLYTAPMTAGTYHVTATSTDEPSASDQATVTVPAQAPTAPTGVSATPAPGGATVQWSPPSDDGGAPISSYTVTASPGNEVVSTSDGSTTSAQFTGLDPSKSYTFTVTATNSAGLTGPPSSPSAAITPENNNYVVVQPAYVHFPNTQTGSTSPPQTVTVYATSSAPLAVSAVGLSGHNPDQFALQSDNCSGKTVPANGSCTFAVVYKPTASGSADATATITDDDPSSPQEVSLSHAQVAGVVTEFSHSITASSGPFAITAGPDGNLWFIEHEGGRVGLITPQGQVTEFSQGITPNVQLNDITLGPDGNLWFTEQGTSSGPTPQFAGIGQITPKGQVTIFTQGITQSSIPWGITAGPDGNIWFTEYALGKIGQITPQGHVTEFSHGITTDGPIGITTGPDGNLWYTEYYGSLVGQITPQGQVTEFTNGITPHSILVGITQGPDGALWFTEQGARQIGRITTQGQVTEFPTSANDSPWGIAAGPDGYLWFTGDGGGTVGRITTAGQVTEFSQGIAANSDPLGITPGPDGNMWFTEHGASQIGQITP